MHESDCGADEAWWMELWSRWLERNPKVSFSITMAATVLLAVWLPRLSFDTDPNATFASNNEASRDLARLHGTFGPDDTEIAMMLSGDRLLEPDSLEAFRILRNKIRELPEVDSFTSILDLRKPGSVSPLIPRYVSESFDSNELLQDLSRHPVASKQMISEDGKILVAVVTMRGDSVSVDSSASLIEKLRQVAGDYERSTGSKIRLAGHPPIRVDVLLTIQRAMFFGCTAAIIVSLLVSLLMFRKAGPMVAVLVAPFIGSVWTFGWIALAGVEVGGLLTALPNLVFVVGLTDSVHLVLEYQRHLRIGNDRRESVRRALIHVGPACFLTSLTTFIGFGSLALSKTSSVQQFGTWSAIGTTLVLLAVITVLPLILLLLPATWMQPSRVAVHQLPSGIAKILFPALRRPILTTLTAICLSLTLFFPAITQQPDIVWTEAIPDDSSSVIAMRQADQRIGGALPLYVMISWPDSEIFPNDKILSAAAETHRILRATPKMNAEFSMLNVLATAPGNGLRAKYRSLQTGGSKTMDRLLNPAQRSMLVQAKVPNDGAHALNQRVSSLESDIAALSKRFPGFKFSVTGTIVAASKNMNAIIVDLARSLGFAAACIFLVFTLAFRSLRIGLVSFIPNVLPLLVAAASLHLLGLPLQITSAVTFSLCLGLAVDDTIHVIVRFRSMQKIHSDPRRAMEAALTQVGPALVVTTLILLGGFCALMVSPLPSIRLFSTMSVVILISALAGDLLLLPGMLLCGWGKRTPT